MNTKIKIATAASAIALMMTANVSHAQDVQFRQISFTTASNTQTQQSFDYDSSAKSDIEKTADQAARKTEKAAEKTAAAAEDGYENVKDAFADANLDEGDTATVRINTYASAEKIIGKPVFNSDKERIGTINDIIIGQKGDIEQLVIANGGLLSVGDKEISVSYQAANLHRENDMLMMDLSEADIENSREFSYNSNAESDSIDAMSSGSLSIAKLMGAELVGPDDEVLAEVENFAFNDNGSVDKLLVKYDQTLGLGGDLAAVDFGAVRMVSQDESAKFELSDNQVARFKKMHRVDE